MHIKIQDLLNVLEGSLTNVCTILDGDDIPLMISTINRILRDTYHLRYQMDVVARSIDRLYRPVIEFLHSHPSPRRLQVQTVRNLLDQLRHKLHQPYEEIALAIAVMANVDLEEYARAVVDAVKPIHMTLAFITTFDADEDVYYSGVPPTEVPVPPQYYRDQDGAPIIPPLQRTPRGRPSHQSRTYLQ